MKTLGFELSKKLNDLGILDDIDTKYVFTDFGKLNKSEELDFIDTRNKNSAMYGKGEPYYRYSDKIYPYCVSCEKHIGLIFKTLTLEEAIEFLQFHIGGCYEIVSVSDFLGSSFEITLYDDNKEKHTVNGGTLNGTIQRLIEYLLDNKLLGNK